MPKQSRIAASSGNKEGSGYNYPPRHQLHGYARELYMDLDILSHHFTKLFELADYFANTGQIKSNLQEISDLIVAIKKPEHAQTTAQKLVALKDLTIQQVQQKLQTLASRLSNTTDQELQRLAKSAILVINGHLDYLSAEVQKVINKVQQQNGSNVNRGAHP